MDTSEQYIKTCDCPEVQRQRKLQECGLRGNFFNGNTWLPRQDQIQEMMKDVNTSTYNLLRTFWGFVHNNWQNIWEVFPQHPSVEHYGLLFICTRSIKKIGTAISGSYKNTSTSGGENGN